MGWSVASGRKSSMVSFGWILSFLRNLDGWQQILTMKTKMATMMNGMTVFSISKATAPPPPLPPVDSDWLVTETAAPAVALAFSGLALHSRARAGSHPPTSAEYNQSTPR